MASKCFTPIQTVRVPSTKCCLCPSMDLIALSGSDRLLIQRTVTWQRVVVTEKTTGSVLCWSPDGSMLAVTEKDGGNAVILYNLEIGMGATSQEEDSGSVHRQELSGVEALMWAHVGLPHKAWLLTNEEKEQDLEWRYRSAYLDRSFAFLPPSSYHQQDGEDDVVVKGPTPECKNALSILCAATRDSEIHLFVHGRYPIAKLTPNAGGGVPRQMVYSSDLHFLSVLQHSNTLTIFSLPALVSCRCSLQTIASVYSSMQEHMRAIQEGIPSVYSSWRNTLRPLDMKLDALQKILQNYGIDSDMRHVLLQHIILGESSEHSNALDQFFSGVQMNDQLLVRMEKTLHNALAGVETMTRSALLAPARSLVFDANELCGLDDQLLPTADTNAVAIECRRLLFGIEFLVAKLVDARFQIRDFVSWLRSAASAVKAKGTPPESAQNENARKRRVPQAVVHRVSDYLHQQTTGRASFTEGSSSTETMIGCCISDLLSGKSGHQLFLRERSESPGSVKTSFFDLDGVPTVASALETTAKKVDDVFKLPKDCIQRTVSKSVIVLPAGGLDLCAIHPRVGVETLGVEDERALEGSFYPLTESGETDFSCSRQWTVVAVACDVHDGQQGVQLILIPLGRSKSFFLSRCLLLPYGFIIKELGFYGDDGKSMLSSNKESDHGKEGRQSLGLLLENETEQQLWLVRYDRVQFQVVVGAPGDDHLGPNWLQPAHDSLVAVFPRRDEMEEGDEEDDPDVLYAKTRMLHDEDGVVESNLILCGSRGVGGVVTRNENDLTQLALFDLEEDEDPNEEDENMIEE